MNSQFHKKEMPLGPSVVEKAGKEPFDRVDSPPEVIPKSTLFESKGKSFSSESGPPSPLGHSLGSDKDPPSPEGGPACTRKDTVPSSQLTPEQGNDQTSRPSAKAQRYMHLLDGEHPTRKIRRIKIKGLFRSNSRPQADPTASDTTFSEQTMSRPVLPVPEAGSARVKPASTVSSSGTESTMNLIEPFGAEVVRTAKPRQHKEVHDQELSLQNQQDHRLCRQSLTIATQANLTTAEAGSTPPAPELGTASFQAQDQGGVRNLLPSAMKQNANRPVGNEEPPHKLRRISIRGLARPLQSFQADSLASETSLAARKLNMLSRPPAEAGSIENESISLASSRDVESEVVLQQISPSPPHSSEELEQSKESRFQRKLKLEADKERPRIEFPAEDVPRSPDCHERTNPHTCKDPRAADATVSAAECFAPSSAANSPTAGSTVSLARNTAAGSATRTVVSSTADKFRKKPNKSAFSLDNVLHWAGQASTVQPLPHKIVTFASPETLEDVVFIEHKKDVDWDPWIKDHAHWGTGILDGETQWADDSETHFQKREARSDISGRERQMLQSEAASFRLHHRRDPPRPEWDPVMNLDTVKKAETRALDYSQAQPSLQTAPALREWYTPPGTLFWWLKTTQILAGC